MVDFDPTGAALTLARHEVLRLDKLERTDSRLLDIATSAVAMLAPSLGVISVDEVVRQLQAEFDVWVPQAVVVSDPGDHEPWLERRKPEITFSYWNRYRTYLHRSMKPGAVEALDETTDQIVGLMEDPHRAGHWKTYGLVYGQVQSGKTANYTGVICKAIDAGYRVVIILTSQHESLRHQTQERLDREFLGFNSKITRSSGAENSVIIGVGALGLKSPDFVCQAITTRDTDFTAGQLQGTPVNIREVRILVVAKKNSRILENLRSWLAQFSDPGGTIRDLPLLLIDDEADYASVDTKRAKPGKTLADPDHDPTAINKAIRNLFGLFDQRSYVAYTATPFANIFIEHTTNHESYGEDLFPRSFVVALEPPSNYCGPEVVFGLEDPSAAEIREPLPIIREVTDHQLWMPDVHRRGHQPAGALPPSLVEAIDAFVLSTAARTVRSRDHGLASGHNTMLVHVTRYVDVQGVVARRIEDHLAGMRDSWSDYGISGSELRHRLRSLWEDDYEPTYVSLAARNDVSGSVGPALTWESIEAVIPEVLADAAGGVKRINGSASDVLDYQSSTPATVVAIGGDKLSRGLTLEGLTVSYYLRTSRTYDTLLQMGRWFGYRPGYLDVTRLYTTPELIKYYLHITRASRELMDLASAIAKAGQTPSDVGMRVLDGYGNLRVTAAAKMRASALMSTSFAGQRAETLVMLKEQGPMLRNYSKLEQLVELVVKHAQVPVDRLHGSGSGQFHEGIAPEIVLDFLDGFQVSPRVLSANPSPIRQYIRAQMAKGELIRWTVAIAAGNSPNRLTLPGAEGLHLIQRKPVTGTSRVLSTECEVGVLVNPAHEALGLEPVMAMKALKETEEDFRMRGKEAPKRASGEKLRAHRDPAEGLLLVYPIDPVASGVNVDTREIPIVGYAIAFPQSETAERISYRVNQVFLDQLADNLDDADAEDQD